MRERTSFRPSRALVALLVISTLVSPVAMAGADLPEVPEPDPSPILSPQNPALVLAVAAFAWTVADYFINCRAHNAAEKYEHCDDGPPQPDPDSWNGGDGGDGGDGGNGGAGCGEGTHITVSGCCDGFGGAGGDGGDGGDAGGRGLPGTGGNGGGAGAGAGECASAIPRAGATQLQA